MKLKFLIIFCLYFFTSAINGQDSTILDGSDSIASRIPKIRLLVLDFKNLNTDFNLTDLEILSNSLINKITDKTSDSNFEVLERYEMMKLFRDRTSAEKMPQIYDKSSAIELGNILEANYALLGSISQSALFSGKRIGLRIVDIEKGIIISASELQMDAEISYDDLISKMTKNVISSITKVDQDYYYQALLKSNHESSDYHDFKDPYTGIEVDDIRKIDFQNGVFSFRMYCRSCINRSFFELYLDETNSYMDFIYNNKSYRFGILKILNDNLLLYVKSN